MKKKIIILSIISIMISYIFIVFPAIYSEVSNKKNFKIQTLDFDKNELEKSNTERALFVAKSALKGRYFFDHPSEEYSSVKNLNQIWESGPFKKSIYDNNSHELFAHSLSILPSLIIAHKETKNEVMLIKGIEIITSWIDNNSRFNIFQSDFSWRDHSTAMRVINILHFIDYASIYISINPLENNKINKTMIDSASFLSSKHNYANNNNHGIFEDLALLSLGIHIEDTLIKSHYVKLSINRFIQQINNTFSKKGVHLENSPGYHLGITGTSKRMLDMVNKYEYGYLIDDSTKKIMRLALCNKYYFVLNSGLIPPVGDSIATQYTNFEECKQNFLLQDDVAGYQIYKDKAFYLLSRTQSPYDTHKHSDAMSFVYEVDKELIFGEAGFLDYTHSENNKYTKSHLGHNQIFIKNDKTDNISLFKGYVNNNNYFSSLIKTKIDDSQGVERYLIIDKKDNIFINYDIINSKVSTEWIKTLHLGSDIVDVKKKDGMYFLTTQSNKKYYLHTYVNNLPIVEKMYYGDVDNFLGWKAEPFKRLNPSYMFQSQLTGKNKYGIMTVLSSKQKIFDYDKYIKIIENNSYIDTAGVTPTYTRNFITTYVYRLKYFILMIIIIIGYSLLAFIISRRSTLKFVLFFPYLISVIMSALFFWKSL